MSGAAILAVIDAALMILERVFPMLAEAVKGEQVTVEAQAERLKRLEELRLDAAFSGSEWERSDQ